MAFPNGIRVRFQLWGGGGGYPQIQKNERVFGQKVTRGRNGYQPALRRKWTPKTIVTMRKMVAKNRHIAGYQGGNPGLPRLRGFPETAKFPYFGDFSAGCRLLHDVNFPEIIR